MQHSTIAGRLAAVAVVAGTLVGGWAPARAAEAAVPAPAHADLAPRTFNAACAYCHYRGGGKQAFGKRSPLGAQTPDELAQFILFGKAPEDDEPAMPGFASGLTDANITQMIIWLRSTTNPETPWADVAARVAKMRATGSRED